MISVDAVWERVPRDGLQAVAVRGGEEKTALQMSPRAVGQNHWWPPGRVSRTRIKGGSEWKYRVILGS